MTDINFVIPNDVIIYIIEFLPIFDYASNRILSKKIKERIDKGKKIINGKINSKFVRHYEMPFDNKMATKQFSVEHYYNRMYYSAMNESSYEKYCCDNIGHLTKIWNCIDPNVTGYVIEIDLLGTLWERLDDQIMSNYETEIRKYFLDFNLIFPDTITMENGKLIGYYQMESNAGISEQIITDKLFGAIRFIRYLSIFLK